KIYLIEEIHTPDSSRYLCSDIYEQNQIHERPQKQLSKEFLRQWHMANGLQGKESQQIPEMTDAKCNEISMRYSELHETVTGESFVAANNTEIYSRIERNVNSFLSDRS